MALCLLCLLGCALPKEVEEGEKAWKQKDWDKAAEYYRIAAFKYPEEETYKAKWEEARKKAAEYHWKLAEKYRKETFELHKTLEELDKVLQWTPEDVKAKRLRSRIRGFIEKLKAVLEKAKECIRRKDWLRAEKLLYRYRQYSATIPEIQKVWKEAADGSFKIYVEEGMRYYYLFQYGKALQFFKEAARIRPKNRRILQKIEKTKKKKLSQELFFATMEYLKKGRYKAAREKIKKALELDPENERANFLYQEATRKRVKKLLAKAEELIRQAEGKKVVPRREIIQAYLLLEEASALKPPGKLLQKKLQDRLQDVRKRLAAELYVLADRLEREGAYASAWVRFQQVALLWPKFANVRERLQALEERIRTALQYRLVVLPKGSKTPKRVRQGALKEMVHHLTAELQKQLPSPLFQVYSYVALAPTKKRAYLLKGLPVSGILGLRLDQFEVLFQVDREEKTVPYTIAVGKSYNPKKQELWTKMEEARKEYEGTLAKWKEAEKTLEEKKKALQEAEQALKTFLEKNPPPKKLSLEEEASDPRTIQIRKLENVIQVRKLELENYLKGHITPLKEKLEQHKQQFLSLKEAYLREPILLDKKYRKAYRYTRLHITKTGTMSVKVVLWDLVSGQVLLEKEISETVQYKDSTQQGFEPAGVEEDPLRLPSNREIEEELKKKVLKQIVPLVKSKLKDFQRRFLIAMKEADKKGQLHYAVLAYLARQDKNYQKGRRLDPKVDEELRNKILELSGYDIQNHRIVKTEIKY